MCIIAIYEIQGILIKVYIEEQKGMGCLNLLIMVHIILLVSVARNSKIIRPDNLNLHLYIYGLEHCTFGPFRFTQVNIIGIIDDKYLI